MTDDRFAWEPHTLDMEQLDLFAPDQPEPRGAYDEPDPPTRVYQLTELPGTTFEEIFGDAA